MRVVFPLIFCSELFSAVHWQWFITNLCFWLYCSSELELVIALVPGKVIFLRNIMLLPFFFFFFAKVCQRIEMVLNFPGYAKEFPIYWAKQHEVQFVLSVNAKLKMVLLVDINWLYITREYLWNVLLWLVSWS